MTVNVVSETVLSPKHMGGIHTAFLMHTHVLKKMRMPFYTNSLKKADVTHLHTVGLYGLYKLLTSKHVVISTHLMPDTFVGSYKTGEAIKTVVHNYLCFFYSRADAVIALNGEVKKQLEKMQVAKKIVIIPNAIDTTHFKKDKAFRESSRKQYKIAEDAFVVLGVGNMIQRKGIFDFITLAQQLPQMQFVWVGGKQLFNALSESLPVKYQKLAKELPNLIFIGHVNYKEMPKIYNIADVFFFPSYHEIASMTILEAAACGLPLVLRDLPDYRSLYDKSYFSGSSPEQFKKAIVDLATDKEIYQKTQRASLSLAKKFSLEAIGEKLLQQYSELLED